MSRPFLPAASITPRLAPTHVLWARRDSLYPLLRQTSTPPLALEGCATPSCHACADTSPKIMARAYFASNHYTSTTTTCLSSAQTCTITTTEPSPSSPPPPTPYNLSRLVGSLSSYKAADYANYKSPRLPMPLELAISSRAHWLSRVRSCLRLLIIVLSGAVVCMLMHTFEIYRGNRYIDLRKGELPMVWPAHTNLAPSIVLFAIAAGNFLASVAILTLSFKRSFRRPFRSRDVYRIVAGSFGVIMWVTALVVFNLLDKASKASLGRYSCTNANVLTNGRYQYRAVCEEQVIQIRVFQLQQPLTHYIGCRILHCYWCSYRRAHHTHHPCHLSPPLCQEPGTSTNNKNPREEQLDKFGLKVPQTLKTIAKNTQKLSFHNTQQ